MAKISIREILAMQVAVGGTIMAKGPVEVVRYLFDEDHPLQLPTMIVESGNRYEHVKRLYALFLCDQPGTMTRVIRERENQLLAWIMVL